MHNILSIIVCVFKSQLLFFVIILRIANKLNKYSKSNFAMLHVFISNVRKILKSFVDVKKLLMYNIYLLNKNDNYLHNWIITKAIKIKFNSF